MLSIAHHHVEVGIVLMIQNADHLVVKVQFILGRVLVVLNSFDVLWSDMRSESSFEFELRL